MRGFDMKDIYSNNITLETTETITKMIEIRKKILETYQKQQQSAHEAQVHPSRSAASDANTQLYVLLDMD